MNLGEWVSRRDRKSHSAVAEPFAIGAEVGGYRLEEPLGAGGMAEVWKATSFGPGGFERQVVIKKIQAANADDPEFLSLFLDEARISGLLHHPNVVEVHRFGEHGGTPYLVMEYVEGPSVARVLRGLRSTGRRMPWAIAAYFAREVCRALDYVHDLRDDSGNALGIVHRDVTPSNVLLTRGGCVKLLDFGVAKFSRSASMTRAGMVRGKPAYLAPEQIEEKPIDRRVDLFSLGIVLHEMLSLEHLFASDSDLVTVRKVMEMEIPRPSTKCADVRDALDAIVMKALERNRDQRYQTAAEMAHDLDEVVIASGLRVEEIVAFIASVEADLREGQSRAITLLRSEAGRSGQAYSARSHITEGRTVRDHVPPAHAARARRPRTFRDRRSSAAAVAGVALVATALAAAFGLHVNITTRNAATAAPAPAIVQCGDAPG
jgi:serine/threonine protein kinase